MLKKTNILALVGGGKNPRFALNKIIIWDDHQGRIISQLRFNKNLLNVKLRIDSIIGICDDKIYIFNLNTLETIAILDTFENYLGLAAISNNEDKFVLAFPYFSQGTVQIKKYINSKDFKVINAHESKIAYLTINKEATLLATASDKGTLIRIFKIENGDLISELRRGTKNVTMTCISFDQNNRFIGCASDVGTIHIFSIFSVIKTVGTITEKEQKQNNEEEPKNQKSFLGKLTGMLKIKNNYLDSERSFAKFRIQEHNSILAFGSENTFYVLTSDGKYYYVAYDPKNGGDCIKINEKNIMNEK